MSEQSAKGFVLVKVVNFVDSVFDTDQISVFRGGSELARWLPYHLQGRSYEGDVGGIFEPYEGAESLQQLSLGGSQGLYAADAPEVVASRLAKHLGSHSSYRYLSIEVAGVQADSVQEALPKLMAKIAWQQMQSHRIKPDFLTHSTAVCALTGVRAASPVQAEFRDGDGYKSLPISPFALLRLQFGRQLRKNGLLLRSVARDKSCTLAHYTLCENFEEIASKHDNDEREKLAYLYWDGNSFGKLNAKVEKNGNVREWDSYLRDRREELMAEIIDAAESLGLLSDTSEDPNLGGQEPGKKRLRLEPLLWGGDESLLVLPAAAALPLLNFIQQHTCQWQFSFDDSPNAQNLTHAFGLLICSPKTPVREARAMAIRLAEVGKSSDAGRLRDSWTFAVLNSIDYEPTGDMRNYLVSRYGKSLAPVFHGLCFSAEQSAQMAAIACIVDSVSRGQLRRMAGSVVASNKRLVTEDNFAWKRLSKQLVDSKQDERVDTSIQLLCFDLFGQGSETFSARDGAVWAFLEELYSYLPKLVSVDEEGTHETA